jgi:Asp-tRNA(Asn)/Glu-tRNA(Gln) amidotransferase A subunit family amidase
MSCFALTGKTNIAESSTATLVGVLNQSAVWIAREIKSGRVSAAEVIQAHLARIEETQPRINAAVEILAEQALAAARNPNDGPMMGVPISIKDSIDVAGVKTTSGSLTRNSHRQNQSPGVAVFV